MTDRTLNSAPPFTLAGMRRGVVASQPLAVGVFVYGAAFGLLAREALLSLSEALLMSGIVYSGSAQLVAVSSMGQGTLPTGTAALAVLATILLLNARYILYGAALRSWLGQLPAHQAYPTLAVLGDGNWILSMKAAAEGENDAGFVFGSGLAMFVPWLGGTWLGSSAGALIAQPAAIGLDFMLVAFSAALACGMFKGRSDLRIIAAAAMTALVTERLFSGGMAILAAGLAGAVVAWADFKAEQAQ
ncbi:MAG: AzlC family ABC transporter permease [Beijerinckiaceae bacterium]